MTRRLWGIGLIWGIAAAATGQEVPQPVVSWDIEFWAAGVVPGTGAPIIPAQNFLKATSLCNQAPVALPPGPIVNPSVIRVDDPDLTGRECVLGPNSSGILLSLPIGVGMVGTAVARGATLSSGRSAVSNPFNRAVISTAPNVPTVLKIVRP